MIKETTFEKLLGGNPDACISWALMASFLYYKEDKNLMTDEQFDQLMRRIFKDWKKIKHPHKKLFAENKKTNNISGFNLEYPLIVKGAAFQLEKKLSPVKQKQKKPNRSCVKT